MARQVLGHAGALAAAARAVPGRLRTQQSLEAMLNRSAVFHHRETGALGETGVSRSQPPPEDGECIRRIVESYKRAAAVDHGAGESQWTGFLTQLNSEIHEALLAGDIQKVTEELRHPAANNLFYGFENIRLDYTNECRKNPASADGLTRHIYDCLARLAEALGAVPVADVPPSGD